MKYFLILLLGITCCASTNFIYSKVEYIEVKNVKTIPVFIDNNFSSQDKIEIDNAINAWNYALNGNLILNVKSTTFDMEISNIEHVFDVNGLIISLVNQNCINIPKPTIPKTVNIAWADNRSRQLIHIVRDRVQTQDIFGVMLHEVGHILGANHIGKSGLMSPIHTIKDYECIDKPTITQVAKFNNIDVNKLNYCIKTN